MQRLAFTLLSKMERTWWYRGRGRAVLTAFHSLQRPIENILDYGAGFGGMGALLSSIGKNVYAYEPDAEARAISVTRGYTEMFDTDAAALSQTYDAITLFDVLEHIQDDKDFIERIRPSLTSNGYLVLTVPAIPFLWSVHDIEHHHFRRYRLPQLKSMLQDAGYRIRFASYWNMSLFLPAALMRMYGKTGESGFALPAPLNGLLYLVVKIEAAIMRYMQLPFGTGIVVLAEYTGITKAQTKPKSDIVAE